MNLETAGSVDRLVLGLANQPCQRRDEFITEEMTNHLFQTPGFSFGMDLASLNIQRGRDHGLPPYVRWREPCGLSPIRTFEDLERVMSSSTARKFRSLYSSVEDIDLFPAGLAEKSVLGGLVGPTFACIIGQQFSNLRRGDRFWYENAESESSFTSGQLQQIRRATLAQVLCKTMDAIDTIQPFVFLATDTLKNRRLACNDPAIGQLDLEFWAERSSKFRHNANDPRMRTKRTAGDADAHPPVPRSKETASARRKAESSQEPAKTTPSQAKPFRNNVHQNNRIVVKRPIGRPENLTIWVQNNAVNAPVFVNDGIYGSNVRIQQYPKPTPASIQGVSNYSPHRPTTIPHSAYPYVPQAYNDPSNPNPLAYGYKTPAQEDVFYDNYSPSSPRPTLYTYYTNFQSKPTTQASNHEVDGYLINYGSTHHEQDSFPAHHVFQRPKPQLSSGHPYDAELEPTQRPTTTSARPSSRPNYASSDDQAYHNPGDYAAKPPTIPRPSVNLNDEFYQKPQGHNRPRPTSPSASRPIDGSYHTQKPVYSGFIQLLDSRLDSTANYLAHNTQRPGDTGHSHLQNNNDNNNLSDRPPSEGYSANPGKPQQHQDQWSSSGYQKRPTYDYDDPDVYHKRPNVKLTQGAYAPPGTNVLSRPENTRPSNPSSAYSQGSTASNNYDKYPATTPAYQSRPTFTPSSWPEVSSYTEGSNAPSQSESFESYSSPSYQKPTTIRPVYEKDDRPQLVPHQKESIDQILPSAKPYQEIDTHENANNPTLAEQSSYSNPQQSQPTPNWSEFSTIGSYAQRKEGNLSPRPTKVHSVTIVTEAAETVHHPGHSGYIDQFKVTSEVPRPLAQQTKESTPVTWRPGQYYYEKNVLHRYPNQVVDPKSNSYSADEEHVAEETPLQDRGLPSERIVAEMAGDDSITDVSAPDSETSESKLTTTTTSTLVTTDYDNNGDDVVGDLEGAFSAVVERAASPDVPDRYFSILFA